MQYEKDKQSLRESNLPADEYRQVPSWCGFGRGGVPSIRGPQPAIKTRGPLSLRDRDRAGVRQLDHAAIRN